MRALTAFTMLCALGAPLGATAQAMIAPFESQTVVMAFNDSTYSRSAAQREAKYFRASQSPVAAERNYPCRLQLRIFEKPRLAQSCQ